MKEKDFKKYGKLVKKLEKPYFVEVYVIPKSAYKEKVYPLVVIVFRYHKKYREIFTKHNVKKNELSKVINELMK